MSLEECESDMETERSLFVSGGGPRTARVRGSGGGGGALDDERTLDEEEALAAREAVHDPARELQELQQDQLLPLPELLALYGCPAPTALPLPPALPHPPGHGSAHAPAPKSRLRALYEEEPPRLRSAASDEEDDGDYSPDEDDWKKTIMVGSDYQAQIPDGLCSYDDALPYENEDRLVWSPSALPEADVERYLRECAGVGAGAVSAVAGSARDDEHALFLLQQCAHSVEEALRRRRVAAPPASPAPPPAPAPPAPAALWSEEECRNFENGLKVHGKDFNMIRQTKVRTRSVGELVQFYYIWKKTERHDIFANKARLEKKKYTLHPGHTDYMDRFLEEQEPEVAGAGATGGSGGDPLALGEHEVFAHLPHH